MDLAVLPCLDTDQTAMGEQFPAGVARFLLFKNFTI
jgi:hypothetical protein